MSLPLFYVHSVAYFGDRLVTATFSCHTACVLLSLLLLDINIIVCSIIIATFWVQSNTKASTYLFRAFNLLYAFVEHCSRIKIFVTFD